MALAIASVSENNPGYLLSAERINPFEDYSKIDAQAILPDTDPSKELSIDLFLEDKKINARYELAKSIKGVTNDQAIDYAFMLVNDNSVNIAKLVADQEAEVDHVKEQVIDSPPVPPMPEIDESMEKDYTPEWAPELELTPTIPEEEQEVVPSSLLTYFLTNNKPMLEKALVDPTLAFIDIKNQIDEEAIASSGISDELLMKLEKRIAREMELKGMAKRGFSDLRDMIWNKNNDLRYLVHSYRTDFTILDDHHRSGVSDERVRSMMKLRAEKDPLYHPEYIAKDQALLRAAIRDGDGKVLEEMLDRPMVSYSSLVAKDLKGKVEDDLLEMLEARSDEDLSRGRQIALIQNGEMQIDFITGEVVEKAKLNITSANDVGEELDNQNERNRRPGLEL